MDIIRFNGFDPLNFEFKSSTNYSKNPSKANVRRDLKDLLQECKLGLVAIPRANRDQLGFECIKAIKQFLNTNEELNGGINIYFDQGMFKSVRKAELFVTKLNLKSSDFHFEQDSKKVLGIQLADLAAHILSTNLKDKMGLITKKVKAGENSGYPPDLEIEIGFEMWATLRYSFFKQPPKIFLTNPDPIQQATYIVEPYGLYISDYCDKELADIIRSTFSKVYLGCIH